MGLVYWLADNQGILFWLTGLSVLMFLGTLVLVPLLVIRIPATYFAHRHREERVIAHRRPVLWLVLELVKSAVGVVLILAGMLMLVLPGQGVLTILMGLTLLNFPGKFRLERWVVSRPAVYQSINWLRRRAGRHPLIL
ncbi:MAG: hypothetical protein JJT90_10430 [Ectothiorhodospiraceae bacterium]|nr:hypothetical protein [Ectothiorhodospiraceae bacterium]